MLSYQVMLERLDSHGRVVSCKDAQLMLETDESDRRLELLHENVRQFGTVFNTLAPGTEITGRVVRAQGEAA